VKRQRGLMVSEVLECGFEARMRRGAGSLSSMAPAVSARVCHCACDHQSSGAGHYGSAAATACSHLHAREIGRVWRALKSTGQVVFAWLGAWLGASLGAWLGKACVQCAICGVAGLGIGDVVGEREVRHVRSPGVASCVRRPLSCWCWCWCSGGAIGRAQGSVV